MGGTNRADTDTDTDPVSVVEGPPAISPREDHDDDFRMLVNSLQEYAIIRLDPQGVVQTWSTGAQRLKGYQEREIVGQHFAIFYTPGDRAKGVPMEMLDEARANGNAERTGWRVRKDGRHFWGDVSLSALRDDRGRLLGFAKVVRDLTERHEYEETLRRSEERLRLLIGSVIDYAIIGLDPQGIVESWNAGAERIKGYFENEIVGQHFSVFYGPEDRAAGLPLAMLDEARKHGHAGHTGPRVRKDGTLFWGDVVVTSLRHSDGSLVGFVKITRDLSERHAAEEAARQAVMREEQAAEETRLHQLRSDFMQSISHDLRAPLTAIKGFAHLLRQDTPSPEDQKQFLAQIEDGADRLAGMVEDLLELAKIESGAVLLRPDPIALSEHAERVVANLAPLFGGRRVDNRIDTGTVVLADAQALDRMLVNLLSNAAKYSPSDSLVTLDAHVTVSEVTVSVADDGAGVAPEDREVIFQRFRQSSHPRAEHARGIGLGLSMVRDYAELHGGRAWVDDNVEGGARFCFTLPVAAGPVTSHSTG